MWWVWIGRDGLRGEIPGSRFTGLKSDLRRDCGRNVNIRIMYIMLNHVSWSASPDAKSFAQRKDLN